MSTIVIVDCGIGNVLSVQRAFERVGASVRLSGDPTVIREARVLVLPGVGAFGDAMQELEKRKLIEPIQEFGASGRPFLGICLGMQMMMQSSEEFGLHQGLGFVEGKVTKISETDTKGEKHKIPHIGWTGIQSVPGNEVFGTGFLKSIEPRTKFYFVHSYTPVPVHEEDRLADAFYGGRRIAAIMQKGNLYGCQFHPEKSGEQGLTLLKNFVKLAQ